MKLLARRSEQELSAVHDSSQYLLQQLASRLKTVSLLGSDICVETKTQLSVYLPIRESISTTVQHQMVGCQRGLSLSKLATHGYNNSYKRITKKKETKYVQLLMQSAAGQMCIQNNIKKKRVQHDIEST